REKAHRISRRYSEQQTAERPYERCGSNQSDTQPKCAQQQALPQDEPEYVATSRAKSHSDSNLALPLCHRIRNQCIHSEARQQQGKPSERSQQERSESLLAH